MEVRKSRKYTFGSPETIANVENLWKLHMAHDNGLLDQSMIAKYNYGVDKLMGMEIPQIPLARICYDEEVGVQRGYTPPPRNNFILIHNHILINLHSDIEGLFNTFEIEKFKKSSNLHSIAPLSENENLALEGLRLTMNWSGGCAVHWFQITMMVEKRKDYLRRMEKINKKKRGPKSQRKPMDLRIRRSQKNKKLVDEKEKCEETSSSVPPEVEVVPLWNLFFPNIVPIVPIIPNPPKDINELVLAQIQRFYAERTVEEMLENIRTPPGPFPTPTFLNFGEGDSLPFLNN